MATLSRKEAETVRAGKRSSAPQSKQIGKETELFGGVGKSTHINLNQADSCTAGGEEHQSHQDLGVLSAIKKHPPTTVVLGKGEHRGILGNELHTFARANRCHGCSPSRQGTCQVKAVETWRLELSVAEGTGSSGSPAGKGSTALPSQHQK